MALEAVILAYNKKFVLEDSDIFAMIIIFAIFYIGYYLFIYQLSHVEQSSTGHQLSLTTARSRVAELTSMHQSAEAEIARLRRDNDLVSDRISELQKQVMETGKFGTSLVL